MLFWQSWNVRWCWPIRTLNDYNTISLWQSLFFWSKLCFEWTEWKIDWIYRFKCVYTLTIITVYCYSRLPMTSLIPKFPFSPNYCSACYTVELIIYAYKQTSWNMQSGVLTPQMFAPRAVLFTGKKVRLDIQVCCSLHAKKPKKIHRIEIGGLLWELNRRKMKRFLSRWTGAKNSAD